MIDLDANATTALAPEALEAMMPWLTQNHANASGSYHTAKLARHAIDHARAQVAELLGAEPEEIIFTSSGTESANTALNSLNQLTGKGAALVSSIEHSAVLKWTEAQPRELIKLAVNSGGQVEETALTEAIETAAYVSIMAANNETGVIQPLHRLLEIARSRGLPFHTDATQVFGKIPFSVKELPVDMLTLSAHKFHGPKGVGALYVRAGLEFTPLLHGGAQENGRRSSTENVAGIVAMGAAAELAHKSVKQAAPEKMAKLRDQLEQVLLASITGCVRNGNPASRLPNTSHLSFDKCDAAGMLILLDKAGVAASAGSACMTGKQSPSHVQLAMGISPERAKTSLRFSISRHHSEAVIAEAIAKISTAVEKLRSVQGATVGPVSVYSKK